MIPLTRTQPDTPRPRRLSSCCRRRRNLACRPARASPASSGCGSSSHGTASASRPSPCSPRSSQRLQTARLGLRPPPCFEAFQNSPSCLPSSERKIFCANSFTPSPSACTARVAELRVDIATGDIDGGELVGADAPVDELVFAGGGVVHPALAALHQRHRQRPIFLPDRHLDAAVGALGELGALVGPLGEAREAAQIGDVVARKEKIVRPARRSLRARRGRRRVRR